MKRPTSFNPADEKTHRSIILKQIDRCNHIISTFNASEEITDPRIDRRTYTTGGQEGKAIALSVRVLLSNARKALPKKFFENLQTENKYRAAFEKQNGNYGFLAENPNIQYDAILRIMDFYDELLAAIYSIDDFSDIKYVRENRQKSWGNEIDEEELFELKF